MQLNFDGFQCFSPIPRSECYECSFLSEQIILLCNHEASILVLWSMLLYVFMRTAAVVLI